MTTQTLTSTVEDTTVADIISDARKAVQGQWLVPLALCTDALLDCFNAAANPTVKSAVRELLPDFATGSLRKADDFLEALDHIQRTIELSELEVSQP